jgi:hypothetical protein
LGCDETRRAALIDPLRERIERYLGVLAYHGYRLEYVIGTTPTPTTAPASSSWGAHRREADDAAKPPPPTWTCTWTRVTGCEWEI